MKSKRTRIIIAASAATLLIAGLITFFVTRNRHKLASYEVRFELAGTVSEEERSATKLPETVKVQEGTLIGTLAKPTRDGAIFMSWTYDEAGLKRANENDPIKSDLVLYPRFVKAQGLSDITGFSFVSKTDVPADYEVELITYGLTRAQLEELLSVTNESRAGEAVPYMLISLREQEEREWFSSIGMNAATITAVWECVEKSESDHTVTLTDLLNELLKNPGEGVVLDEVAVEAIVNHFSPIQKVDTLAGVDGLDDQTINVMEALGIDFATVTEDDLKERYGLDSDDSVERFWREEVGLSIEQVLTLERFLYGEKSIRGDHWKLHYAYGEWEGGDLYTVKLANTAKARFLFDNEPTAKEVVDYNITIHQEEVQNLNVDSRVIHLSASEVSGVDFRGVLTLETDENGEMTAKENSGTGILTYTGKEVLPNESTVAVHKGAFTEDGLSEGDVAYVKIKRPLTEGRYEFEYAGLESILSAQNVIPVRDDGSYGDGKVTVNDKELNFSDTIYRDYGLDNRTIVKAGDILCFYKGKLGGTDYVEAGFGKITGITKENGKTTFAYEKMTEEELTAPETILYTTLPEIEFDVTDNDTKRIEEEMKKQVYESGIVDETKELFAMLLTDEEIDFDRFEHGDELRNMIIKTDGEDITLEDIRKLSSGGSKVKVDDFEFSFNLGINLNYLGGKGLRAEAAVSFKITIQIGDHGGVLEIVPAIILEQEIKLTPSVKVKRNKNRIGLTSSLDITASLDAGTYTGFGVVVTAMTKEGEGEEKDQDFATMTGNFISNGDDSSLKGRASAAQALITAGNAFTAYTNLDEMKDKGIGYKKQKGQSGEKQEQGEFVSPGLGGGLPEKYSNMLGNDAEYIKLVNVDLASLDLPIDPCGIIHVGMKINFHVSLKINAMIGAGISYENEKLYSYAFRAKIWGGGPEYNAKQIGGFKQGSSVTDIKTSCFRADFYAFGMIGLRAGVSLDLRVGVFSTDLDSVGIVAEAGLYAELYGFLYVHYELKAGQPAKSGASGSLYFEVGIYTDISVMVQVAGGAASKKWSLYNSTIPLLKLGCEYFPLDFAIDEDDEKLTITIPSTTNCIKLDSDIFKMKLMALKTGEESEQNEDSKVVNTEDGTECTADLIQPESETNGGLSLSKQRSWMQYNEEHFTVECFDTDADGNILPGASSFQYLPGTNEIYICPIDCTKTKFYGKIVFTYRNNAFGFSTEKIQRTVNVSWEGVLRTARVEYFREVSTLGAFEQVGTGSVTGLENTYCYVAVTQELANMFPGYKLDYLAYPDEKELLAREIELSYAVGDALAAAEREHDPAVYRPLYAEHDRLLEELRIVSSLYRKYKETNEEAIAKCDGSNTYFTLRGMDTVVRVYFRRYQVDVLYAVYDEELRDKDWKYGFTTKYAEVLNGFPYVDNAPDYIKEYRPEVYESMNWYIFNVPFGASENRGSGVLNDYFNSFWGNIRKGDLTGLTPITAEKAADRSETRYALIYGIPVGKEHTIHWMDDGKELYTTKVRYREEIKLPQEPTKEGCVFSGWELEDGSKLANGYIMDNGDLYATASWAGDEVKATWITDDGQKIESVIHVNDRIYMYVPEEIKVNGGNMMIWRSGKDDPDSTIPYDFRMDKREEVTFYGRPGVGFSTMIWVNGDTTTQAMVEIGKAPKRPEITNAEGLDLAWKLQDGTVMQNEFIMPRETVTATAYWHNHEWSEETKQVMATCRSDGHEGVYCTVCGLVKDGKILPKDKNAHVWVDYVITASTCTEKGVMGRQCDYCDTLLKNYAEEIEINPINHVHLELRNERIPSCEMGYSGDTYCADCGEFLEEGHLTSVNGICYYSHIENKVEPTCTTGGYLGDTVCDYCGRIMASYSYKLPPKGHTGVMDPKKSKAPTCDEEGIRHMVCVDCGYEWDEVRAPERHVWDNGTLVSEATCEHGAIYRFHCSTCNEDQECEVSGKLDHCWTNEKVLRKETCYAEGLKQYTCKYCGITKEEPIPKNELHTYDNGVITKDPTCHEPGIKTYTCTGCGHQFTAELDVTDHRFDVVGITKEPTCTETGIRLEKCINCGDTREIVLEKNPMNHVHLETVEVVKEATCISDGVKKSVCKDCGANVTEKTPALGHDWSDPVYEWAADYSSVTATRKCNRDHSHDVKETVKTTSKVTKEPTAQAMGDTTYTAKFKNEVFTTQTKTVTNIDKIDETWNAPTYTWSKDYKTVTAKRVKRSDASKVETETVQTTAKELKKATCDADGETVYTAEFKNDAFTKQTKSATVAKLGHKWETVSDASTDPEMILNEDGGCIGWKLGKKHMKCTNCGEEKDENVKVPLAITSAMGDVCTSYSKSAITFDLRKIESEYGFAGVEEWIGDRTFAQALEDMTYIAAYNKASDGWWLWEGEQIDAHFEIHYALMQHHPAGSLKFSDSTLANTKMKDFTGDKAVITVTFNPRDTATYNSVSTKITIIFP